MFNGLAARMGFGAAKIDAILNDDNIEQCGTVSGVIKIVGGNASQHIEAVDIHLMTLVKSEIDDKPIYSSFPIEKFSVPLNETINSGEEMEFPFEFPLHLETPVTALNISNNKCQVWLQTSLDIDNAIDPTDKDTINVYPHPTIAAILNTIAANGGYMQKADVEKGTLTGNGFKSTAGFYQEFEFKINGREVELSFIFEGDMVHCLIEKDRFIGGDSYTSVSLPVNASNENVYEFVLNYVF
ncbi:sporulation protein [Vibrio owensii]|uniref:sporulation protein n=1 Tax=Vibrio harveyi group TaxID=717610 RepID=UPI003CC6A57D